MNKKASEEQVRELAHRLWEQRGRPHGRSEEDWYAAEKRLSGEGAADSRAVDEAAKGSFPASDAPSSNLPDPTPVNAEEKWAAAERKKRPKAKSAGDERARTPVDEKRDNPRRNH